MGEEKANSDSRSEWQSGNRRSRQVGIWMKIAHRRSYLRASSRVLMDELTWSTVNRRASTPQWPGDAMAEFIKQPDAADGRAHQGRLDVSESWRRETGSACGSAYHLLPLALRL